ncbi:MAG: hypothetical protein FWG77_02350 [Treponema sp.]|nr:hypothetical protein [Treponema sp.]
MSERVRKLGINCGQAILLKDREGMLENYDKVSINCGQVILTPAINAKLSAMGAKINSGNMQIKDIKGEVLQLELGAVIDGGTALKDIFVIAKDDIIITKEGVKALEEAEGLIALGKIFYPESTSLAGMAKVSGKKIAYPDGTHIILGNHKLESIIYSIGKDKKHIWISGRLTVLDRKHLEEALSLGIKITCAKLFSYEGFLKEFGSIINCSEQNLVPDGYEITGKISSDELLLYGKKLYVDGKFHMDEKDLSALEDLEGIIVKGKAYLPSSAVKTFRSKGKADEYIIFDGRLVEVNGVEQYSHDALDALVKKGEKISLSVNGCLLFDKDVTAEDMECIASLSYNGAVLIPGAAKAMLTAKVKKANGFMGDPEAFKEMTGQSMKDFIDGNLGGLFDKDPDNTNINIGFFILA